MSDRHHLPLLTHDLQWPLARARVTRDPDTGLWCWEHQCAQRLPGRPFHGAPKATQAEAFRFAVSHVGFCL